MLTTPEFLTVTEAARRLEVSANTNGAWGAVGQFAEYRHALNNDRLFRANDVEKLRRVLDQPVLRAAGRGTGKPR